MVWMGFLHTTGCLKGNEQLQAIAQGLALIDHAYPEAAYPGLFKKQVDFVLAKNHTVAEDLKKTRQLLRQVAACLRYPADAVREPHPRANPQQVTQEMELLIQQAHPEGKVQRA